MANYNKYLTGKDYNNYYKYYHISEPIPGSQTEASSDLGNYLTGCHCCSCCHSCTPCRPDNSHFSTYNSNTLPMHNYGHSNLNHYFDYSPYCGTPISGNPCSNNYYY